MKNTDKLHIEYRSTPNDWVAYYDPEGLTGCGHEREFAIEDLLERTDEEWRKALDKLDAIRRAVTPEALARRFHDLYETMAPLHGYETRDDTREFDPMSKNGKLMVAVCDSILRQGLIPVVDSNGRGHPAATFQRCARHAGNWDPRCPDCHKQTGRYWANPATPRTDAEVAPAEVEFDAIAQAIVGAGKRLGLISSGDVLSRHALLGAVHDIEAFATAQVARESGQVVGRSDVQGQRCIHDRLPIPGFSCYDCLQEGLVGSAPVVQEHPRCAEGSGCNGTGEIITFTGTHPCPRCRPSYQDLERERDTWKELANNAEAKLREVGAPKMDMREKQDALRWRWWRANHMKVGRDEPGDWTCWVEIPCIAYRSQTTDPDELTDVLIARFPLDGKPGVESEVREHG